MKKKIQLRDKLLVFATASFLIFLVVCKFTVNPETLGLVAPMGVALAVTPSVPVGLYAVDNSPLKHGQIVRFCPPPTPALAEWHRRGYWFHIEGNCPHNLPPFMKPVAALPGDHITLSKDGMTVNGHFINNSKPLAVDAEHRRLIPYPFGTYTVQPGQVWFVSHYMPNSVDGRYFGPVGFKSILSPIHPVITLPNRIKQTGG